MREQGIYNKKRLVAVGFLILLIILMVFLVWWWFLRSPAPEKQVRQEPPKDRVVLPPRQQQGTPAPAPALSAGELEVMALARNFTERYGSFSTDSSYQNLYDLFPVITARLRRNFEQTIAATPLGSGFQGTQTKVIKIDITSLTGSRAAVTVTAQRVATDSALANKVTYEDIELAMVKQGDSWFVDQAQWKEE